MRPSLLRLLIVLLLLLLGVALQTIRSQVERDERVRQRIAERARERADKPEEQAEAGRRLLTVAFAAQTRSMSSKNIVALADGQPGEATKAAAARCAERRLTEGGDGFADGRAATPSNDATNKAARAVAARLQRDEPDNDEGGRTVARSGSQRRLRRKASTLTAASKAELQELVQSDDDDDDDV